jgi:hypothetical protein
MLDQSVPSPIAVPSVLARLFFVALAVSVHFFVAILIAMFLVFIASPCIVVFDKEDMTLGTASQYLVRSAEWAHLWYPYALLLLLIVDSALALILHFAFPRQRWMRVLWFDGFLLAAIIALLLAGAATVFPFIMHLAPEILERR